MSGRSRNWCYTLNNPSEADVLALDGLVQGVTYHVCGKETSESGTLHAQGFIVFENPKSLAGVKLILPRAHWEIKCKNSSFVQASDYCKKDGDFIERGTLPLDPVGKGQVEQERWREIIQLSREGNWETLAEEYPVEYGQRLKTLEYIHQKRPQDVKTMAPEVKHRWYFGKPGTGKSRRARYEYPDAFIKDPKERWWDGYDGQESVIIDDFDIYQKNQGGDMKRWLDLYPFQAPFKGGYRLIRPKMIVVTSNYHPSEIWDDQITVKAISRRVELHRFVFVWTPPEADDEAEEAAMMEEDLGLYAEGFNPPPVFPLVLAGGGSGEGAAPPPQGAQIPVVDDERFEISSNLSEYDYTDHETSNLMEIGAEVVEPSIIFQGFYS